MCSRFSFDGAARSVSFATAAACWQVFDGNPITAQEANWWYSVCLQRCVWCLGRVSSELCSTALSRYVFLAAMALQPRRRNFRRWYASLRGLLYSWYLGVFHLRGAPTTFAVNGLLAAKNSGIIPFDQVGWA